MLMFTDRNRKNFTTKKELKEKNAKNSRRSSTERSAFSTERWLEDGAEEEEPKRACRAASVEFSLANLPSVELCARRAVIKSQSEGRGTTGGWKKREEGWKQKRSF